MGIMDLISEYIIEPIGDFFSSFGDVSFGGEIFTSIKFWVPVVVASGLLYFVLNSWKGKVAGLTGYYIIGGVAIILFGYIWAARSISND